MWTIYLITRLSGIIIFLRVLGGALLIYAGCTYLNEIDNEVGSDNRKRLSRLVSITFITGVSLFFVSIFVPSQKDALLIYTGGTVLDYTRNNKTLQEMPDKVVKCFDKLIDEYLNGEKQE